MRRCEPIRQAAGPHGIISPMAAHPAISIDPEIQGGTPCFTGTRVPVKSLFDWLAAGETLDYFLSQFPSVTREQALAVLEEAGNRVASTPPKAA